MSWRMTCRASGRSSCGSFQAVASVSLSLVMWCCGMVGSRYACDAFQIDEQLQPLQSQSIDQMYILCEDTMNSYKSHVQLQHMGVPT